MIRQGLRGYPGLQKITAMTSNARSTRPVTAITTFLPMVVSTKLSAFSMAFSLVSQLRAARFHDRPAVRLRGGSYPSEQEKTTGAVMLVHNPAEQPGPCSEQTMEAGLPSGLAPWVEP